MTARRVYDALLLMYPADFRGRYGDEMRRLFLDSYRDARLGAARTRFWFRTLRDTVVNGFGSRLEHRRRDRSHARRPRWTRVFTRWREGTRVFRSAPGFSLLTVGVLAVGIGTGTVIGAAVYSLLLAPLPYAQSERVVVGWGSASVNGQFRDVISGPVALDLIEQNTTMSSLAAFKPDDAVVMRDGRPDVVPQLTVTTEFFASLGVEPLLGRWFEEQDGVSGSERVVVTDHGYWRDVLGGDSSVVGQRIILDGAPHTVIGVTRPDFFWPGASDLIVPLERDVLRGYDRTNYNYWLVGRMKEATSLATASADLNRILDDIKIQDPRLANWSILVEPFHEALILSVRPALLALIAAVGFLWLISVANVTNLLLIRTSSRLPAFALHRALGASPVRLLSLVLGECAWICLAAFGVALAAVFVTLEVAQQLAPPSVPIPGSAARVVLSMPSFNVSIILIGGALTLAAWALSAVPVAVTVLTSAPAAFSRSSRTYTSNRRSLRTNLYLVVLELTTATVLLVGAGLALRTLTNLARVDPGLEPDGLLTMYVGDVEGTELERARFFEDVLREVAQVPGVARSAVNDYVPFQQEDDFEGVRFPDRPPPPAGAGPREEWRRVSADYFQTAGIRIVSGRAFTLADNAEAPSVAVVNEAFADRYYPGEDPVGRRFRLTHDRYELTEVVGVARNVRRRGLEQDAPPVVYVPFQRSPRPNMALFVRTEQDPESLIDPVREAVWRVGPDQPIDRIATMRSVLEDSLSIPTVTMRLVGALAVIALLLATIGVSGVMAYSVRQREHEIGIRLAVGAAPGAIVSGLVRDAFIVTATGLSAGVAAALVFGRAIRGLLYGVSVLDPVTIAVVAAVMALASGIAAYLPARKAGHIDPVETLRAN